ncbi:MAG: LysM peptidoglycan-binding domain-containing protein [Cytophagales bacterium]|nr:MAG: LysM peptidoglycan-binding domain-containing protein [Cytophagales bacterium]
MKLTIVIILSSVLFAHQSIAQSNTKKGKDFFQTKAPGIHNNLGDSLEIEEENQFEDDEPQNKNNQFNPNKSLTIVSEDTSSNEEGETSIIEVAEQIKLDSIWVTYAEYFSVWDSRHVNPYKIDGSKFSDTINFTLFDSSNNFNYSMPLKECKTTSIFGRRYSRWHYGIDLDLETGEPVMACFDGIVRICQIDGRGYGKYILLRHYNGFETLYGHLSRQDVKIGQLLKAGEQIGLGGNTGRSTGSHLHFEVRYEGNALNPENVYDFANNRIKSKIFQLLPEHFEYLKDARKIYYHKVRSGESLGTIARKYRVSLNSIYKMNRMSSRTVIRPGRRIRIR